MSSTALRSPTIVDAVIPGSGVLRDSVLVVGGAALTAVCAQVTIPWQPVPFTLQTLSVMLCGLSLGVKRGALSQLVYVSAGIAGVPVFAEGKFGFHIITGATGGYLLSYALVAALLGLLAERGWTRTVWKTAAAMAIGDGNILAIGAAWLSAYIGWKGAIQHGIAPFLVAEVMKAIVVIVALPTAWKIAGERGDGEKG